MEQTVNLFNKGLQMDTNPMVQGSDTLSDALNATFVTMNGNEVILQNDMGNRRVDNAYLPPGYEPVGIKEYGGVIYLALYNPITNKSLIGSFPSPERDINGEDNPNLGGTFNLTQFIPDSEETETIKFLKSDVILTQLTEDTSLHAGDKFTVYSDDIWVWGNNDLLNNFNYKSNKYFTLSLGIINSLNEFVDITKSLERFDFNGTIIKQFISDEDKFNKGYFIAPSFNKSSDLNRDQIAANTYAYKLVGPLYLKAELNHIRTFNYTISSSKTDNETNNETNNKITLYITGIATYNCPDNEMYLNSFDFYYKFDSEEPYNICNEEGEDPKSKIIESSKTYDSVTGLYTSTITKKITIDYDKENNKLLNYYICVPTFPIPISTSEFKFKRISCYLQDLSEEGVLTISNIGTNKCELDGWRYRNEINEDNEIISTTLTYSFDCYNDSNTLFKDLSITLREDLGNEDLGNKEIELVNLITEIKKGKFETTIYWSEYDSKIKFRSLYKAEITYKKYENDELKETINDYRFILGTNLFNDCYSLSLSNKDYTKDYKIFMRDFDKSKEYEEDKEKYKKIREKYLKPSIDLIEKVKINFGTEETTKFGQLFYNSEPSDSNEYYSLKHKKDVKLDYSDSSIQIKNIENYPNNINLSNSEIKLTNPKNKYSDNIEFITEGITFSEKIYTETNPNINDKTINYNQIYKDVLKTKYKQTTCLSKGIYVDITSNDVLNKLTSKGTKNIGFYVSYWFDDDWNNRYNNIGFYNEPNPITHYDQHKNVRSSMYIDSATIRRFNQDLDEGSLMDLFNDFISAASKLTCPFIFIFQNKNAVLASEDENNNTWATRNYFMKSLDDTTWPHIKDTDKNTYDYCKVWWKSNGDLILLNPDEGVFETHNNNTTELFEDILNFLCPKKNGNPVNLIVPSGKFEFKAYFPDGGAYAYNNQYNLTISTLTDIKISGELGENNNNYNCLEFINPDSKTIKTTNSVNLKSDPNFYKTVSNIVNYNMLDTFVYKNSNNQYELMDDVISDGIYYKDDNNFIKIENLPIQLIVSDSDFPLLCFSSKTDPINYGYLGVKNRDMDTDWDPNTAFVVLDFNNSGIKTLSSSDLIIN